MSFGLVELFKKIIWLSTMVRIAISATLLGGGPPLSHQDGFGNLFAQMDAEFGADGVKPNAGAVGGGGDIFDAGDVDVASGGETFEKLADVNVRVALGADALAVIGHAPILAPQFLRFFDGRAVEFGARGGGEVVERVRALLVKTGKSEPTVGFARADVFQEKYAGGGILLFGFHAEAALAGVESGGAGGIAGALRDVGERGKNS